MDQIAKVRVERFLTTHSAYYKCAFKDFSLTSLKTANKTFSLLILWVPIKSVLLPAIDASVVGILRNQCPKYGAGTVLC